MSDPREADTQDAPRSANGGRATVLAILGDAPTRALLPRVLSGERLFVVNDAVRGLEIAQAESPDVVFVDITIGNGAGLAMVHHMKAMAPDASVFALATKAELEAAAHAVALGGTGLLMLPVGGDEILSAVGSVKMRMAERAVRAELEQQVLMSTRAAGWIGRMAELAVAQSRTEAAQRLAEVMVEATGATGAVVYLAAEEPSSSALVRAAATPLAARAPLSVTEPELTEYTRRERLLDLPLVLRSVTMGHVLLLNPEDAGRSAVSTRAGADSVPASTVRPSALRDGLLKLLATQASAALALLKERERLRDLAAIKDATSSAYSLGFYGDVAVRELYKASRFGRRLSIAVFLLETPPAAVESGPPSNKPAMSPAATVDHLLMAAPEMSVLGRVDEREIHLLLPESGGLAAHACRRKALARLVAAGDHPGRAVPRGVLAGVATFPHDGPDLAQLLRVARRRADAGTASGVHQLDPARTRISDDIDILVTAASQSAPTAKLSAPRPFELTIAESAGLAASVVLDAMRGGAVLVVVTYHPEPNLFAAVRAVIGAGRQGITFRALDIRAAPGCADIEALCVLAEHGAYVLAGRVEGGWLRGAHASDPLLVDTLAEGIGRAAGVRLFG